MPGPTAADAAGRGYLGDREIKDRLRWKEAMVKQQLTGAMLLLVGIGILTGGFLGPFSTYQEVQSHETTDAEILGSDIESATEQEEGEWLQRNRRPPRATVN